MMMLLSGCGRLCMKWHDIGVSLWSVMVPLKFYFGNNYSKMSQTRASTSFWESTSSCYQAFIFPPVLDRKTYYLSDHHSPSQFPLNTFDRQLSVKELLHKLVSLEADTGPSGVTQGGRLVYWRVPKPIPKPCRVARMVLPHCATTSPSPLHPGQKPPPIPYQHLDLGSLHCLHILTGFLPRNFSPEASSPKCCFACDHP